MNIHAISDICTIYMFSTCVLQYINTQIYLYMYVCVYIHLFYIHTVNLCVCKPDVSTFVARTPGIVNMSKQVKVPSRETQ